VCVCVCVDGKVGWLVWNHKERTNEKNKNLGEKETTAGYRWGQQPEVATLSSKHKQRNNPKVCDLFLFLQWKPFVILSKTTRRFLLWFYRKNREKKKMSFFKREIWTKLNQKGGVLKMGSGWTSAPGPKENDNWGTGEKRAAAVFRWSS
jgi:hypothetical protein